MERSTQRIGRKREKPTAAKDDELPRIPNRDDRTAIELFLREIRGWEAGFHHFFFGLAEGKRSQPVNSLAGGLIG
jgi:hypothetical protein